MVHPPQWSETGSKLNVNCIWDISSSTFQSCITRLDHHCPGSESTLCSLCTMQCIMLCRVKDAAWNTWPRFGPIVYFKFQCFYWTYEVYYHYRNIMILLKRAIFSYSQFSASMNQIRISWIGLCWDFSF